MASTIETCWPKTSSGPGPRSSGPSTWTLNPTTRRAAPSRRPSHQCIIRWFSSVHVMRRSGRVTSAARSTTSQDTSIHRNQSRKPTIRSVGQPERRVATSTITAPSTRIGDSTSARAEASQNPVIVRIRRGIAAGKADGIPPRRWSFTWSSH